MQLSSLLATLLATLRRWLEGFVELLPNLALAIVVVLVFGYASRHVGRLVRRMMQGITTHATLGDLLGTLARVITLVCGLLLALGLLHLDKTVTSLLAGVGVVGLALGFAFQDIAANFMSGFLMVLRPPFAKGDLVETGGQSGTIERVELRATLLTTLQGLSVIIPNKDVFQNPIINYTRTGDRRMDLLIGITHDASPTQARELALTAAVRHDVLAAAAGVAGLVKFSSRTAETGGLLAAHSSWTGEVASIARASGDASAVPDATARARASRHSAAGNRRRRCAPW